MSKPTNGKPQCSGCGKTHLEVFPLKLVALADGANICGECVDLASEIVHDYEGGTVRIAPKDLEELRTQARRADHFGFWLDMVRDAVERADARLKEMSVTPAHADGEAEYASWAGAAGVTRLDGNTSDAHTPMKDPS